MSTREIWEGPGHHAKIQGGLRMPVGTDKVTENRKLFPTLWLLSEKWGWLRVREPVGRGGQRPRGWGNSAGSCTPTLGFSVGRGVIVEQWLRLGQDYNLCTFKSHSKELPLCQPTTTIRLPISSSHLRPPTETKIALDLGS